MREFALHLKAIYLQSLPLNYLLLILTPYCDLFNHDC